VVEIHPSARKHGIADGDILHAMKHALVIGDRADRRRLYLGPARNGALLEVVAVLNADGSERVIHAMKMRAKYVRSLGGS
jgi:hypothetical protein